MLAYRARISSLARRLEPKCSCICCSTHNERRISSTFRTSMLTVRAPITPDLNHGGVGPQLSNCADHPPGRGQPEHPLPEVTYRSLWRDPRHQPLEPIHGSLHA